MIRERVSRGYDLDSAIARNNLEIDSAGQGVTSIMPKMQHALNELPDSGKSGGDTLQWRMTLVPGTGEYARAL